MHDMHAYKKVNNPSRMRKYYSGGILYCGVLRHYVSQNIVTITGSLRLNRFRLLYVFNWQIFAVVKMWNHVALYKYLRYQVFTTGSNFNYLSNSWFPLSCILYVQTCMKFTFANNIEAMNERLHVSVKVEPRSTSCLISTLYVLPLFYLRD